jgi:hypothetical protein
MMMKIKMRGKRMKEMFEFNPALRVNALILTKHIEYMVKNPGGGLIRITPDAIRGMLYNQLT